MYIQVKGQPSELDIKLLEEIEDYVLSGVPRRSKISLSKERHDWLFCTLLTNRAFLRANGTDLWVQNDRLFNLISGLTGDPILIYAK